MTKKILVVIDMQNDFITGSLGTKEAEQIVDNVKNKILTYDKQNIYATRDTHYDDYLDTEEGKNLPIKHCMFGTVGHDITKEIISLLDENNIIDKNTFGSIELADKIKKIYDENNGNISIELCGLCTDICVISNALILKAYMPNVEISIDNNCTAGVTPELKDSALKTMASCQIHII